MTYVYRGGTPEKPCRESKREGHIIYMCERTDVHTEHQHTPDDGIAPVRWLEARDGR